MSRFSIDRAAIANLEDLMCCYSFTCFLCACGCIVLLPVDWLYCSTEAMLVSWSQTHDIRATYTVQRLACFYSHPHT